MTLISNITSESGSLICPGVIQLTCIAQLTNQATLRWFLNSDHQQEQVHYSAVSYSTDIFPKTISEIPQILILSANLSVADRQANFLSTLTTDVLWFNYMNVRNISCGSFVQSASFETNFYTKGKHICIITHKCHNTHTCLISSPTQLLSLHLLTFYCW